MKHSKSRAVYSGDHQADVFERLSISKGVKFSLNQLDILRLRMREAGVPDLSTYVREAALSARIIQRLTPEQTRLMGEMARLGNNLNQIARQYNVGEKNRVEQSARLLIDKLNGFMDRILSIEACKTSS